MPSLRASKSLMACRRLNRPDQLAAAPIRRQLKLHGKTAGRLELPDPVHSASRLVDELGTLRVFFAM